MLQLMVTIGTANGREHGATHINQCQSTLAMGFLVMGFRIAW
jgi:hypothetical protein